MNEVINFQLESINLEHINPLISRYKLYIAYASEPANNYVFSEDVLNNMSSTIKGCPVVTGFMNNIDGKVLGGHEGDLALDENNKIKRTPTPIPVGFAAYDVEPWWEDYKGRKYLTTFIYIWDGRYPELQNLSDRRIFQSMEVAVENDLNGRFKIVSEAYTLGLCLLENVAPAFENSSIEKFSLLSNSSVDYLKQEYETFKNKYNSLDFTIPTSVKETTKLGLDLYKKYNKGGTSVSLANARFIQKNDNISPEKIRNLFKNCSRIMNKDFNKDDESDINWISFNLWGATEGYKWAKDIIEFMKKIDEEKLSYFTLIEDTNSVFVNNINSTDNEINKEGDNVIKEAIEKFSLTAQQIHEILNNALAECKYGEHEYRKYYVRTFDSELVYVCDYEDDKTYSFKYLITENVANIDMESKDEVIDGGFMSVKGKENTEALSDTENENLSSNAYVDNTALQELNDKAAIENEKLSEEQMKDEHDKDKIIAGMTEELSAIKEDMSKMKEDMTVYMDENTKLKEFKANIEKQNKEFEIEMTLKEVMSILPQDEIDTCRMSSENFTLEDINIWKNEVQAKAFKFSKNFPERKPFTQIGLPYSENKNKEKGLWD